MSHQSLSGGVDSGKIFRKRNVLFFFHSDYASASDPASAPPVSNFPFRPTSISELERAKQQESPFPCGDQSGLVNISRHGSRIPPMPQELLLCKVRWMLFVSILFLKDKEREFFAILLQSTCFWQYPTHWLPINQSNMYLSWRTFSCRKSKRILSRNWSSLVISWHQKTGCRVRKQYCATEWRDIDEWLLRSKRLRRDSPLDPTWLNSTRLDAARHRASNERKASQPANPIFRDA